MQLERWSQPFPEHGIHLRGWRSPDRGLPLLHLLHGNGLCGRAYAPFLSQLADSFDLWLCDLQGHGDSDAGAGFLGWNRNAELALQTFRAHHPAPRVAVYGVGHSFGGVLTALLAARAEPPFSRVVLLDPVIYPPMLDALIAVLERLGLARYLPLARSALRRRRVFASREEASLRLQGRGVFAGWHEAAFAAWIEHALTDLPDGRVGLKCPPELEARIFASRPRGLWPQLARIAVPTLLLHGRSSMGFVATAANRLARIQPAVCVESVTGGHCFVQESPAATAARVRQFLSSG